MFKTFQGHFKKSAIKIARDSNSKVISLELSELKSLEIKNNFTIDGEIKGFNFLKQIFSQIQEMKNVDLLYFSLENLNSLEKIAEELLVIQHYVNENYSRKDSSYFKALKPKVLLLDTAKISYYSMTMKPKELSSIALALREIAKLGEYSKVSLIYTSSVFADTCLSKADFTLDSSVYPTADHDSKEGAIGTIIHNDRLTSLWNL